MENQVQRYNVLCVTKRYRGDDAGKAIHWHVPITGVAEVVTSYKEELGVKIRKVTVRFQGGEHKLLYVRSGLCGSAVTIAIERPDYPYDVWELYTDTPADNSSVEEVRRTAQNCIASSRRW